MWLFFSHPSFPLHQPHVRVLGYIPSNSASVFLVWVGPTVSPLLSFPIRSGFPLNFETFVPEQLYSPNPHRHYVLTGLLDGFHIGFNPARVNLRPSHRPLKYAAEYPAVIDKYLSADLKHHQVAGPHTVPPFPSFHTSLFGVLPQCHHPGE